MSVQRFRRQKRVAPQGPPSTRWHIGTYEQPCIVVFEPVGSEYELQKGERLLVEVYGESRPEDGDIDFVYDEGRITFWIGGDDYRVLNAAGEELRQL